MPYDFPKIGDRFLFRLPIDVLKNKMFTVHSTACPVPIEKGAKLIILADAGHEFEIDVNETPWIPGSGWGLRMRVSKAAFATCFERDDALDKLYR